MKDEYICRLQKKARDVAANAYCKYSDFQVGCAVLTEDEEIYTGCNVENAAYGSTICAEANAISNMVSQGCQHIVALALYTPTDKYTYPCGNCRQIIQEFADAGLPIYLLSNANDIKQVALRDLFPSEFILDLAALRANKT